MAAVEAAARDWSVLDMAEEPIAPEEGPGPAVERLLGRLSSPPDDVVGTFSLQQVSLRTLNLPFSDRKRIDQVLPFELEGLFPFDPEDLVFNYFILRGGKKGEESELLVGAARKEAVAERIEAYREAEQEPRHLWLDGFALEAAWQAGEQPSDEIEEDQGVAYLHIDADSSLLTLTGAGTFRSTRYLRTGRHALIKRWADKLGVDEEEFAAGLRAGGSEEERAALLQPLIREVELTMRSAAKTVGVHPVRLGISGELAGWPGMLETLAAGLNLPVERLAWTDGDDENEPVELGDYAPLVGAAVQTRVQGGLDLRCGEFTYTRKIQLLQGKLLATGSLALVLLLLVLVGDIVAYFSKSAEADRLGSEIHAVFQETFPDEPLIDPPQQMQIQVREMRQEIAGGGGAGVVDIFRALSDAIDDDVNFVIREFFKDRNGFRVRSETDSYETVEQIRQALEESPDVPEVEISDSRSSQRGVEFDLVIGGGA